MLQQATTSTLEASGRSKNISAKTWKIFKKNQMEILEIKDTITNIDKQQK